MPVLGQEDCPNGVRKGLGLFVKSPLDLVGSPSVPHALVGWLKDLGSPHIPGDDFQRGSEDRRSGEEKNSKSGREFHCDSGVSFVGGGGRGLK